MIKSDGTDRQSIRARRLSLNVRDLLFLDLECLRYKAEVAAAEQVKFGVGVVVTYSTTTQEFAFHTGDDLKPLAKQLHEADLVVGYNLPSDFKVVRGAGVKLPACVRSTCIGPSC